MTLAQLQAAIAGKKTAATAIIDRLVAAGTWGDDSDPDNKALADLEAEIDALAEQEAKLKDIAEKRRAMAPTASRPALDLTSDEPNPATTGGFKSLAEFAVAVRSAVGGGEVDNRFASTPTDFHTGGGSSGEGFLIPTEYRDQIVNAITEVDNLVSRFTVEPTSQRSIEYVKDETTPWGASGIQAHWRAEGSQMTASKLATQAGRLELHDLFAFAGVTEEMLSDAPRLNNQLTNKAAQAIAWKAGEAVMWGDGVGKPLGLMNSDALITVAKEASQVAGTVVADNVNKMYSRQLMNAGDSPFWVANIDIFPQLQAMAFGTDTPLFLPPGAGITQAPNGLLLGYPIVYTEHAETVGTEGDLVLIRPAGYLAAQRQGTAFAESMHLWFDFNMRAFRWTFRMGGQPVMSAPVSPARGAATKSHFVALATRS